MAREKTPAFQFYPKDFLCDEAVRLMSHTERGIYITLICLCWLEGSLPKEPAQLAKMVSIPVPRFLKLWNGPIATCFQERDGRLVQRRLEKERAKQEEYRANQAAKGRQSAVARFNRGSTEPQPHVSAPVQPEVNSSSPISDLQSPVSTLPRSGARDDLAARAGKLLQEDYPAWYAKYRHGARLRLMANPLLFQDALSLVSTWDDDRLEKLARIVLTTDDEWVSRTDRGFKIFVARASWADDRLRQMEAA